MFKKPVPCDRLSKFTHFLPGKPIAFDDVHLLFDDVLGNKLQEGTDGFWTQLELVLVYHLTHPAFCENDIHTLLNGVDLFDVIGRDVVLGIVTNFVEQTFGLELHAVVFTVSQHPHQSFSPTGDVEHGFHPWAFGFNLGGDLIQVLAALVQFGEVEHELVLLDQ